jgi:hypothetical protein
MKYTFKYYLHDNYERGELEWFLSHPKFGNLPEPIAVEIASTRPFYEVTLNCEYDTETGETKILSAHP